MESSVRYSYAPALREISGPEDLEIHFADAKMLEGRGYTRNFRAFEGTLPAYPEGRHHLALVCTFTRDGRKWRQSQMSELVQAIAKVGDTVVEFTTTPDFRQVSNNQWNSWIVFSSTLTGLIRRKNDPIRREYLSAGGCGNKCKVLGD